MSELIKDAKSVAKRVLDVYFAAKVFALRSVNAIDFPVPPNHNLRTTSSTTIRHYYESGLTTALPIMVSAMHEGFDLDSPLKVLDFGCGVGRQILQIKRRFPNMKLAACDVDADVIKYIKQAFPDIDAYASSFDPPLKFQDGTFDIVYSVSIFSHLSPSDRETWLRELSRVLKPGGIACLTFNGLHSLRVAHSKGRRRQFTEEEFARTGYVFDAVDDPEETRRRVEKPRFGQLGRGITRIYGETYYHPSRVAETFELGGFHMAKHLPGIIDSLQDLVVLRKGEVH